MEWRRVGLLLQFLAMAGLGATVLAGFGRGVAIGAFLGASFAFGLTLTLGLRAPPASS